MSEQELIITDNEKVNFGDQKNESKKSSRYSDKGGIYKVFNNKAIKLEKWTKGERISLKLYKKSNIPSGVEIL